MNVQQAQPPVASKHQDKPVKQEQAPVKWQNHLIIGIAIATCAIATAFVIAEAAILIHEIAHDKIWRPNPDELEKNIKGKFSPTFIQKIKDLSLHGIDYIRLFKRLAITEGEEKQIISYLEDNFEMTPEQLKEILMGAHVRLEDDGHAYEEWAKLSSIQQRLSSHASNKAQFGVRGALIKELLFSQSTESGTSFTWFQLENHPVSFGHIIRHMLDYVKYKLSNQNQGPYGCSDATDSAPIILKKKIKHLD